MEIELTLEGPIARLRWVRPAKRHALTAAMFQALASALAQTQDDPAVRVLLLHGSPDSFTAGYDLHDLHSAPPRGQDSAVWQFLSVLTQYPKPIVAAPCGPAVGIGTTLLLHCDLIYAGDNARFALPFTHLGVCPEAGASLLLPARLGGPRAAALLLLGEPFSAEQALSWGLVNAVLPAADALAHAHSRATALAALPPEALRETKRLMRQATAPFLAATLADEAATFCHLLAQPAAQAALSAQLTRDAGRGGT